MKYLIVLVLLIMICNNTYSQEDPTYTVKVKDTCYTFQYSEELKGPLDDFFLNAELNTYPLDSISNLSGVYRTNVIYHYTGTNAVGLTILNKDFKDFIFINDNVPQYLPTLIETILYHEMFHLLANSKEHCQTILCPYILQDGGKQNAEQVIKTWNADSKKEYFEYLKAN